MCCRYFINELFFTNVYPIECNKNKYGEDCGQTCGNCTNGEQCNHVNGSCFNGCDMGVEGDKCNTGNDNRTTSIACI